MSHRKDSCSVVGLVEFRCMFSRLMKGFSIATFKCLRLQDPRFPSALPRDERSAAHWWPEQSALRYAHIIWYENLRKYHEIRRLRAPLYLQVYTAYRSFLKCRRDLRNLKLAGKTDLSPDVFSRLAGYQYFIDIMQIRLEILSSGPGDPCSGLEIPQLVRYLNKDLEAAIKVLGEFSGYLSLLRKRLPSFSRLSADSVFGRYRLSGDEKFIRLRGMLSREIRRILSDEDAVEAEMKVFQRQYCLLIAGKASVLKQYPAAISAPSASGQHLQAKSRVNRSLFRERVIEQS